MLTRLLLVPLLVVAACSAGPPPDPLTPRERQYVTDLTGIDRQLAADPATSLRLGRSICTQLAAGRAVTDVTAGAQRFAGGEGTISKDKATQLVAAARKNLCS